MDIVIVDDQSSARTMLRNIVQGIDRHLGVHDFGEALEVVRPLPANHSLSWRYSGAANRAVQAAEVTHGQVDRGADLLRGPDIDFGKTGQRTELSRELLAQ